LSERPPDLAITVDLEEWHHGLGLPAGRRRVCADTQWLLDAFAAFGVRATFFVLGEVAERHPELIQRVAAAGHEVGFHGATHRFLAEVGQTDFERELARWVPRLTELATLVRRHLPEFEERVAEQAHRKVPGYALDQLRALSRCGDFNRGFVHLKCSKCDQGRIVPFVCRSRLCPSCCGRTMAERAAWLVDRVLYAGARWRQYVITFPAPLAVGLCFRAALAGAVTRVCMRVLFEFQKARASPKKRATGTARPGAVVWVQRFSDGAGAWLHLHVLAPDGLFRQLPDALEVPFESQPPPSPQEVRALVRTIATRVHGLLRRRAPAAPDDPLLERCAAQQPVALRQPTPPPARPRNKNPLQAQHAEFTLHASTSSPPHCPEQLERLCKYMARPPIPNGRLRIRDDDRVEFTLRRPRRGVRKLLFDPIALLGRMAALIPRPKTNLVLYFGCLSAASPVYRAVVPAPPDPTRNRPVAPARPRVMRHADLIARVFLVDILSCPCGGRLDFVRAVSEPNVVQAILAGIILSNQATPRAPPGAHAPT